MLQAMETGHESGQMQTDGTAGPGAANADRLPPKAEARVRTVGVAPLEASESSGQVVAGLTWQR